MRVQVLQHVPFEGIGSMAGWLSRQRADVRYTRFYEDADLPGPGDLDMVIAMGGPMSVNDENGYPWLAAEKAFVADAIRRGVPVIGICLGAQIIATALGAPVYANPVAEIGWFPVHTVDAGGDAMAFPDEQVVFHWHGETFDLPPGAVHLAFRLH